MSETIYKFYDLEHLTQEDLNKLALERNTLHQENKQLKEKINTYENPEDLTLMFMYCDEKAKDKIKQLKEVIEEVREYIEETISYKEILARDNWEYRVKTMLEILDKVKGSE